MCPPHSLGVPWAVDVIVPIVEMRKLRLSCRWWVRVMQEYLKERPVGNDRLNQEGKTPTHLMRKGAKSHEAVLEQPFQEFCRRAPLGNSRVQCRREAWSLRWHFLRLYHVFDKSQSM